MYRLLTILMLSVSLFSCVATNSPKKEKKAKKHLAKHLKGIQNITKMHPQLVDTFTLVIHDTLVVDSSTIDTLFKPVVDTSAIDSMLFDFMVLEHLNRTPIEHRERIRHIRNQIIKEVLKDTTFTFSDSLVHATFIIDNGKYYFKYTVKQKEIPYVKTTTTKLDFDCEVDKPFWKYPWFYLMLIIILFLLYINVRK